MQAIYDRAKRIRVAAFDVDGVLTDGALHYADSGEESKRFSVHDGHGLRMLQASGVALAIITSRVSRCVEARARNLGIEWLFQGADDKLAAFRELLARSGAAPEACAFVGDDLVDLPVMRRCGLAATVPGAPMPLRRHAHWVCRSRGGEGAVREFAEVVLYAQGALGARVAEHADR
jgi:3-deoxy-D-manno-octulosonate 8-phosphate phosphatase (KDO 8-P phosphatase)